MTKLANYPWSFILKISYKKNSKLARDTIEKEITTFGEWVGHGSGFGAHDLHVAFKTEKSAIKAKKIAIKLMSKYNVNGRYVITKYEGE